MTISHLKQVGDQWIIQENDEHQRGVAERCARFASEFGMADWGRVLGLLHDVGKELPAFQQYIRRESGYDPNAIVNGPHQHAFVGGLVARQLFSPQHSLLCNALMGHHRGLYNCNEMVTKLNEPIPDSITIPDIDVSLTFPAEWEGKLQTSDFHALQRMLFSCLVDADFLDTEAFIQPEQAALRGGRASLDDLLKKIEQHLSHIKLHSEDTHVNRVRNYVQEQCRKQGAKPRGCYSLTVPTGGGKTLSSLLWAMRHAVAHRLQRVIIAIPYTSIIVQTAATLKNIFGEENVLEHHSEFDNRTIDNDELKQAMKLATENWDYPIIVTTNVQLFESLYSHRTSSCRKLHNIVSSVIILDEVQTLPLNHMQPIVDSLNTLHRLFNVSLLFTTASQPILSGEIIGGNPLVRFSALPHITEIIPSKANLHEQLRRVEISFDSTQRTYRDIAGRIAQHERILCVVNTRRDAKALYDLLPQEGLTIHLSRMMCPEHVREGIEKIRQALTDPGQRVIRVVTTQLIEAGIDIDFPVVFRQEAGLDSVLQAAGRCNREGKLEIGHTWVFSLQAESKLPPGSITRANDARINLGKDRDWLAPETMTAYFKQLQSRCNTFDFNQMAELLHNPSSQFETASNAFRLIDDYTIPVVVTIEETLPLIEKLKQSEPTADLFKQLRKYSVAVRKRDFDTLCRIGAVNQVNDRLEIFVLHPDCYKRETGLTTDNVWINENLII